MPGTLEAEFVPGSNMAAFAALDSLMSEIAATAPPTERVDAIETTDYKNHQVENKFVGDDGLVVLPVASRTPAFRLIRLHGGYGTRHVRWKTTREGKPPIIPAATDTAEDKLLSATVVTELPRVNNSGGYDWTVGGEYRYVQLVSRRPGYSALPVGNYPFVVEPQATRAAELIRPVASAYAGDLPFQALIAKAQGLPVVSGGSITWPLLALPAVLSSTHIIGG